MRTFVYSHAVVVYCRNGRHLSIHLFSKSLTSKQQLQALHDNEELGKNDEWTHFSHMYVSPSLIDNGRSLCLILGVSWTPNDPLIYVGKFTNVCVYVFVCSECMCSQEVSISDAIYHLFVGSKVERTELLRHGNSNDDGSRTELKYAAHNHLSIVPK